MVTGGVYYACSHTRAAPATVVMVAVCHFFFNFGANTLTFIIPAEVFTTCYRCTCRGISAAAGKLGSILAVLIVYGVDAGYDSTTRQGLLSLRFGTLMAFSAVYSRAYLPDVQRVISRRCQGSGSEFGRSGIGGIGMRGIDIGRNGDSGRANGRGVHGYRQNKGPGDNKTQLETKSLEDLGEGRAKARREGEIITIRDKWKEFKRRHGRRRLASSA